MSLPCFPAGLDWLESRAQDHFPELDGMSLLEQADWFTTVVFADVTARKAIPDLLSIVEEWRPDLILRDYWEYGSYIVAERLGIPHATVGIGRFLPMEEIEPLIGAPIADLRRDWDLPPDPELETLHRYLYLHLLPLTFQPLSETVPVAHPIRLPLFDRAGEEGLPEWVADLPDRPTVYVTLGTVFNKFPEVFDAVLRGLSEEEVNLIVTVDHEQDPTRFDFYSENVYIERYIPQTLLFPHCDLVVSHGGFNTTMAVLCHSLPHLVIPVSDDQPYYARRSAELGLGIHLPLEELAPHKVRSAVHQLLEDGGYCQRAGHLRQEIAGMPGPERAVELMERLVRTGEPVYSS